MVSEEWDGKIVLTFTQEFKIEIMITFIGSERNIKLVKGGNNKSQICSFISRREIWKTY